MTSLRNQLKKAPKTKLSMRKDKVKDHPAVDDFAEGAFKNVPVEMIKPNPDQPRQVFDEEKLKELSSSIKDKGVLQPVIIRVDEDKNFFLVAGERRLRAAKMAELENIPCIITKGHPAEIALIENLQREDLKPIEEAEALGRMINEYKYTQDQLSQVIGKARTTITEALSLNKLPDEIKEECRRADIYPRRLLVEVAKQKTPEKMISLFNQIKTGSLKSDQVREITRKRKEPIRRTPTAIAIDRAFFLSTALSKLDLNTCSESEKIELIRSLDELSKLIQSKFLE